MDNLRSAHRQRGQAAVEFLITYGWAIQALVLIIAVLLSSGMLSPTFMIAQECNIGSNIPCDFLLYNQGGQSKISLELANGFSYKIKIQRVTLQTLDQKHEFAFQSLAIDTLESGGTIKLNGTLSGNALQDSSINRFVLTVTYLSCPLELSSTGGCSTTNHTLSGRLTGKVNPEAK